MQKVLDAQKAVAGSAAAKAAAVLKPSVVDTALKAAGALKAGGSSSPASSLKGAVTSKDDAAATGSSSSSAKRSPLDHAVHLLAGMRWDGLDKLDAASGVTKKLAVYRSGCICQIWFSLAPVPTGQFLGLRWRVPNWHRQSLTLFLKPMGSGTNADVCITCTNDANALSIY